LSGTSVPVVETGAEMTVLLCLSNPSELHS
jgi:hypothetical protein